MQDHDLTFREYDAFCKTTEVFTGEPNDPTQLLYAVTAMAGELGEVAEKIKKIVRDKEGYVSLADLTAIGLELGDLLWYVGYTARRLGVDLENVATLNIAKLTSRRTRGKIQGEGDNR